MREIYFSLCKGSDTPISLGCWLRFKYDESQLLQVKFNPRNYLEGDVKTATLDYACIAFLSKWKGLKTGINLKEAALRSFQTSEQMCRDANRNLRSWRAGSADPALSSRLFRAKVKIAKLLGPFSLHCISPFFGWGPGATFDLRRRVAQVDKKLTTVPMTVCGTAVELLDSIIRQDLHWSGALLGVIPDGPFSFIKGTFLRVDSCRVKTVPKSAKTDRLIAIEPTGNLFLQKGVGGYFRKVLKQRGIDLDSQEANQSGAAYALAEALATLDLSMASDTVSRELVYELLPYDWAVFLDAIRSRSAVMPDKSVVVLEKWSSMGNGYTFELETLIFWALAASVVEEESSSGVLVYGDDIIVPQKCYADVVGTLTSVGFAINDDKSYHDGLFFESCGKHFFNGTEITPPYQKELLNDIELLRTHNRLVRWALRTGVLHPSVAHPARRLASADLSSTFLPYGVEGDDGFLADLSEIVGEPSVKVNCNRGIRCYVAKFATRSLPGIEPALLAHHFRFHETVHLSERLRRGRLEDLPSLATYGDIDVPLEKTKAKVVGYTYRWVYPPGVQFLTGR